MFGATDLVESRQAVLEGLLSVIEELRLVGSSCWAALGARDVVGDDHDDRVVELALLTQEVEQPPQLMIGMAEDAGEDLHHPAEQLARRRRQGVPIGYVRVVP